METLLVCQLGLADMRFCYQTENDRLGKMPRSDK